MKGFLSLFLFFSGNLFAQNEVIYLWSGGVTPYSVNVNAKLTYASTTVRLVVSTSPQLSNPLFSTYFTADTGNNNMAAMNIGGLQPDTRYYYAVESSNIFDTSPDDIGTFKTFPAGPSSFSFVLGSCCSNSDHGVYDAMGNQNPLFYLNTGDLHYGNPNSATDINVHRSCYENLVLSKFRAATFLKKFPIAYMWDDHDFCGNDCDSSFVGKKNARRAYREYVPHYPLPAGNGNAAIYQSFVVGRVRFILSDLRSDRYGQSMMGAQQKAWFKNECMTAKYNKQIIAWVSTDTWNSVGWTDNWGGYTLERAELSNFFRDSLIENMFILSGDAHMLAIDNGSHADFSTNISNGIWYPIFQAAGLAQGGSYKGGIFSEGGYFPNPNVTPQFGQFGLVQVNDNGGSDICITFSGYRVDTGGLGLTFINYYSFCRTLDPLLSIPEHSEKNNSPVFPDPSDGKFTLLLDKGAQDVSVKCFDITGNEILLSGTKTEGDRILFNEPGLEEGLYTLRITSGTEVRMQKFLICR